MLRLVPGLLAVLLVATFLIAAKARLHFPYELDWVEDGVLTSVQHMHSGLPLYQAPSVDFTPYIYTPCFYYIALLFGHIIKIGYPLLRLISTVSTLGCFAAVYALVYRESRRHLAAFAAVGCFALCNAQVEWFDRGRVDMLALMLSLWALYATRRSNPILAGVLWTCAFQTKQGILPIALLMLCHDWKRPRRVLLGEAAFLLSLVASIAIFSRTTNGWYNFYIFGLHSGLPFDVYQAKHFLGDDLLAIYGIALLVIVAAFLIVPPSWKTASTSFYFAGTIAFFFVTAFIRAHRGASANALLPLYAWIAILFGVALARLDLLLTNHRGIYANAGLVTVLLAVCTQLLRFQITPSALIPKPAELATQNAFEAQLSLIPGNVFVPGHPEYGLQAGKPFFATVEATGAILDSTQQAARDRLLQNYEALIQSGSLNAVALDELPEVYWQSKYVWLPRDFLSYFPLRVPIPYTGTNAHSGGPNWLYLPCSQLETARKLDQSVNAAACLALGNAPLT